MAAAVARTEGGSQNAEAEVTMQSIIAKEAEHDLRDRFRSIAPAMNDAAMSEERHLRRQQEAEEQAARRQARRLERERLQIHNLLDTPAVEPVQQTVRQRSELPEWLSSELAFLRRRRAELGRDSGNLDLQIAECEERARQIRAIELPRRGTRIIETELGE